MFTSHEDGEQPAYISIMLGEYYRFDTASVDNVDLNDESPDITLDSVEQDNELARSNNDADLEPIHAPARSELFSSSAINEINEP